MKRKLSVVGFILLLLLLIPSCGEVPEEVSILDALKISAWVLAEKYEDNGYWEYNETPHDYGCFISDDGQRLTGDEVFGLERLELNKPRVLAPLGYGYRYNLNINFDFDGLIGIDISDEGNEYIRVAHSLDYPEEPWRGGRIEGDGFSVIAPVTVEFYPVGKYDDGGFLVQRHTLTDREYFINVSASKIDGTLVVTAKLKLTVLDDDVYPYPEQNTYSDEYDYPFDPSDKVSRFLSVELVEYDFSDQYKAEMGLGDEYIGAAKGAE